MKTITLHEFEAALTGSRWNLTIPEALACACYLSGPNPKKVNFVDFANLIAAKLNSKAEDEHVRIQRQMSMLRRVSIGDSEIDVEKAKRRWGRMNEMADKAKAVTERRKADFAAKLQALSIEAQKQKEQQDAQEKAKGKAKTVHMGYREQAIS